MADANVDWFTQNGKPVTQQGPMLTDQTIKGPVVGGATTPPSAAGGTGQYSFPIPPGFDPSNPVDKLVLDQFEAAKQKGLTDPGSQPTAENMGYWRTQINQTGGNTPDNINYWNSRMSAGAGGGGGGNGYNTGAGAGGYGNFQGGPDAFVAPSGVDLANDPGFQARLKMGTDALQGSAAARGSVLSGGTLKALDQYSQDYASNEYANVYGRALQGYQTNVGTQRNAMNDYWARLQGLYQGGQNATQGTGTPPSAA